MKLAVIGAGPAGLAAAMAAQEFADVTVFEAQNRVGGRLHLIRDGEMAYDAGGEWIDSDQPVLLEMLRSLDLKIEAASGPRLLLYGGERTTTMAMWPDLIEAEQALDREAEIADQNAEQDRLSMQDVLDRLPITERGRWWLRAKLRSDEGEEPAQVSFLGWLAGTDVYEGRSGGEMSAFRVVGGMGQLPVRMAASLQEPVRLQCAVSRVSHSPTCAAVDREEFDACIVAVPPPSLAAISVSPALSITAAARALPMARLIKLVFEFKKPWWQEEGLPSCWHWDCPLQQVWDSTRGEGRPTLTAYIAGEDAARFSSADDPIGDALACFDAQFPEARAHFVQGWRHDWIADRWAHGGFPTLPPNCLSQYGWPNWPPEGRIAFAGDHCSSWFGFIEGALESGQRAAAWARQFG